MNRRYFISITIIALLAVINACSKKEDSTPLPNQPPTCDIVNPADGVKITIGASIIIVAEASDNDGSIIEVRFFIDGIEKGSDNDTLSYYVWDTSTESIGPHTIKATSIDNDGDSTSDEISVVLTESTFGLLFDSRDGQEYKIVGIEDQTWFAENLNYEAPNSWYYENNPANGDIYGRLYTWDAAQNACPVGWHLPSDDEWKTLEMYLGMSQSEADQVGNRGTDEGLKLKSTDGWIPNNGTNSSSFNALPGGVGITDTQFQHRGTIGSWWVANEYSDELAWGRMTSGDNDLVWRGYGNKSYAYSVRCVKN